MNSPKLRVDREDEDEAGEHEREAVAGEDEATEEGEIVVAQEESTNPVPSGTGSILEDIASTPVRIDSTRPHTNHH